ncbi:hypothetical protein [Exiguobacterium acetylicum]|nr:hypothetical protein [Exiguobacterium acetylicum]
MKQMTTEQLQQVLTESAIQLLMFVKPMSMKADISLKLKTFRYPN